MKILSINLYKDLLPHKISLISFRSSAAHATKFYTVILKIVETNSGHLTSYNDKQW